MQRAIDETDRRRAKQAEHNEIHNITPQGLTKKVSDIMEGLVVVAVNSNRTGLAKKAAEEAEHYRAKDWWPVSARSA